MYLQSTLFEDPNKAGPVNADGLCKCGCGGRTNLASANCKRRGWTKGQPVQFISGHNSRKEPKACLICGGQVQHQRNTYCSQTCKNVGHARFWETKRRASIRRGVKNCRGCGEEKTLNEFHRHPSTIGGRRSYCKACCHKKMTERYWSNPEKYRAQIRAIYHADPEGHNARRRAWDRAHPEWVSAYRLAYKERRRELSLQYRAENYDKVRESLNRWRRANRGKACESTRRYLRRLKVATGEPVCRAMIIQRDGTDCYLCGQCLHDKEITLDHVVPLFRGGLHVGENLRVCCKRCNSRKGTKLLSELDWMPFEISEAT